MFSRFFKKNLKKFFLFSVNFRQRRVYQDGERTKNGTENKKFEKVLSFPDTCVFITIEEFET